MQIRDIEPRAILSSMGNETVEVCLVFEDGNKSQAAVPAGISAGQYEVKKLPVKEAIAQIESQKNQLIGPDFDQQSLDEKLVSLGFAGNAALPISVAFWKAKAKTEFTKFPKLLLLLFEGGKHGSGSITMQEFAIIEESVKEAIDDFKTLKTYLDQQKIATTVGAEGGFSPQGFNNLQALDIIKTVFPNKMIALDSAWTFGQGEMDYQTMLTNYNIASIEDPYSEEAWDKWKEFYDQFGQKIMVVGDDLTVTNSTRLKKALNPQVINALVIKPNQNGTITGALETAKLAKANGLKVVVSHRGEETDDNWIVDFALEAEADFVKFGGMDRGERIAKYNRLRELGMS